MNQDSIDTSSLVAVYDYECQTQDAEGKAAKYMEGYDFGSDEELPLLRSESYCFVPQVWMNYPDGMMTVQSKCKQNANKLRNRLVGGQGRNG